MSLIEKNNVLFFSYNELEEAKDNVRAPSGYRWYCCLVSDVKMLMWQDIGKDTCTLKFVH